MIKTQIGRRDALLILSFANSTDCFKFSLTSLFLLFNICKPSILGPKTFTIFAPIDSAFTDATVKNGAPIWTEEDGAEAAKAIISRHVTPTTLYTAGMRYYIQKDSLRPQSPIHIHKNGGT